jgi:predicted PurR-regulated permease PerM
MDRRARTVSDDSEAKHAPARDPFIRKVAVVVAITALAGVLLAVLILGIEVFLIAFAGVLLAVFLRALTDLLTRYTPLPENWALSTVLVLVLMLLGLGGWLLAPQISEQVDEVSARFPEMVGEVEEFLQRHGWGQWLLEQLQDGGAGGGIGEAVGGLVSGLATWFTYFLTFLFVGLFGAYSPRRYEDALVHLFPLRHRVRTRQVLGEISYTLRWWLIGRAVAMSLVGITTGVVLGLLGMPFALLLGVIAGLFTFVPYLGPIAAGVPIVLFGLVEGPEMALYVLLAYTGIQVLEGYVLDPIIMQQLVYLPPVLTLIMQVLMAVLIGVLGIALATPLAAILIVLTRFYRTDILGEEAAQAGAGEE